MSLIKSKILYLFLLLSMIFLFASCMIEGTAPSTKSVDNSTLIKDNVVMANFAAQVTELEVTTTNHSRVLDIGAAKFLWHFGEFDNNSSQDRYTLISPKHTYQKSGRYRVTMTVISGEYTKSIDKIIDVIGSSGGGTGDEPGGEEDGEHIVADFSITITGRVIYLRNNSTVLDPASTKYQWYFGDTTTSTDTNPVHKYDYPGNYEVTLIATDKNSSSKKQQDIAIKVSIEPKIIAYGDSTLALDNQGQLFTWGANNDEFGYTGQKTTNPKTGGATLGRGTTPTSLTDFLTKSASPFSNDMLITNVFAGKYHAGAITDDDKLYLWGINNKGQLGLGDTTPKQTPYLYGTVNSDDENVVCGKFGIKDMIFTGKNGFALCNNGSVYATGLNDNAQLHEPYTGSVQTQFLKLNLAFDVEKLFASSDTVYAIAVGDNSVYAWGSNNKGVAGVGSNDFIPITVARKINFPVGAKVIKIVASDNSVTVALTEDGRLFGWGYLQDSKNFLALDGVVAPTDVISSPKLIKSLASDGTSLIYRDVVMVNRSIAGVTDSSDIYTWGFYDNKSSLGLGLDIIPEFIDTPTKINAPNIEYNSVKKLYNISAGISHFAYFGKDGYTYGWGDNSRYQLGYKASGSGSVPYINIPSKSPTRGFLWRK